MSEMISRIRETQMHDLINTCIHVHVTLMELELIHVCMYVCMQNAEFLKFRVNMCKAAKILMVSPC